MTSNRFSQTWRRLLAALCLSVLAGTAAAQGGFPSKPVRMIVGFPPGGVNDLFGRVIAQQLQSQLSQPVVVENRPGANSNIAAALFSRMPPDGHALFLVNIGVMVHNRYLYQKLEYDPRDFVPLSLATEFGMMLAVRRESPFKGLRDLVEYGKANPGKLNYGSVGIGSSLHLSAEMFNNMAGIRAEHVPFAGGAQVMNDIVAGRVDYVLTPGLLAATQTQMRPLAVIERKRRESLPDVPAVAEAGLPEFDVNGWLGFVAPKGMTPELVQRLNAEINRALATPEAAERVGKIGMVPKGSTPAQFAQLIEASDQVWAPLIRKLGVRLD